MNVDAVIIGGGLAGLSAAIKLSLAGADVILYEKNPKLGGRTYSYIDKKTGDVIDNGQHILVGAYHNTLEYLKLIGTDHLLIKQERPRLYFHHHSKGTHAFEIKNLPKPFDITAAMLRTRILSFSDRQKLLCVGLELAKWNKKLEEKLKNLTVEEWLNSLNQSESSKKSFWYPIVISVMNESPQKTSALLFARSLKQTFLGKKNDATVLIPKVGQSELYVNQAEKILLSRKAKIFKNSFVKEIVMNENRAIGITADKEIYSKNIISAVPHNQLKQILPPSVSHMNHFRNLDNFQSSPIISIHLWFDREIMEIDFVGLIDSNLQWVFNRHKIMCETDKPGNYISAVISGAYDYINMTKEELITLAITDLKKIFSNSGDAVLKHAVVIKEKHATFSATNDVEPFRLNSESQIKNLYFAGDWTNTGLPATIEGAVFSGFRCADLITSKS